MLLLPLVHFYRKSARDTPKNEGIASTFAMFLHPMPDQVGHDVVVCLDVIAGHDVVVCLDDIDGHDVIAGLTGNLSDYHSRRHTELIINYLNKPPYKFGIKIWLLADMNN